MIEGKRGRWVPDSGHESGRGKSRRRDHRQSGEGEGGVSCWRPWGAGRESRGTDGVFKGFCLRGRGRRRGEKGERGEGVRHVYGSDDDSGGRGRVFIGCADGERVIVVKLLNKLVSIDVRKGLPAVVSFRETFPPDQVLELLASLSCAQDLFDFPFRLSIHKVRSGFLVVVPICGGLFIGCEKGSVEDIMDLPGGWQFEAERRSRHSRHDQERSISPGYKLC
jgi:hypothetical protein